MKKTIFILSFFSLLLCTGCENELEKEVSLDVSVTADGMTKLGDTIVVSKSTSVTFNFSGEPDFISFYSGEVGYTYKYINRTELSIEDIDCKLKFDAFAQYGTIPGTLKVYLATGFGRLTQDKYTDSLKVLNTNWVDISDLCNLPTVSSTNAISSAVSLNDYLADSVVVAFCYKPLSNATTQPTWSVQNLLIENTLKQNGSVTTVPAVSMGFTPFDFHANPSVAYLFYKSGLFPANKGVWNDNTATTTPRFNIQSSAAGADLNLDWLISSPLKLNSCLPDVGIAVKTTTVALDSYTYQYKDKGVYDVTFVATNGNMDHFSRVIKNLVIKVVD